MILNNITVPNDSSSTRRDIVRYVNRIIGSELNNVSKPCEKIKLTRYWKDIQYKLGIDKTFLNEFRKNINRRYSSFKVLNDDTNLIILIPIIYYIRINEKEIVTSFYNLWSLKFYSNIVHRFFPKFCNPEIWKATLNKIPNKHNFSKKHGIGNTLIYFAETERDRFLPLIYRLSTDDDISPILVNMTSGLRTKIFQSMRSFAETYYRINEKGLDSSSTDEDEEKLSSDTKYIMQKIIMLICGYNEVDNRALTKACSISRLKQDLMEDLIFDLSTYKTRDDLEFVLTLLIRFLPNKDIKGICRSDTLSRLVRSVESRKKIGKYVVRTIILDFIFKYSNDYNIKNIRESSLVIFFINYYMDFIRNRVC